MSSIFASGSDVVKVWSLAGKSSPLSTLNIKHAVSDLIWLAGGHHMVHCEADSGLLNWAKFSSGSGIFGSKSLASVPGGACRLAALRSSAHFLSAGADRIVRLVSVSDGSVQRTLTGHSSPIQSISASSSETYCAVAQAEAQVVLHRLSGTAASTRIALPGCKNVQRVRFSNHNDNLLAVVGDCGKTVVWDVVSNLPHATFSSHRPSSVVNDVSFSPRNPLLMVSAGQDRQLIFHDVPKKTLIRSFQCEAELCSAAILHDGFTVVAGTTTGAILVYDLRAGDSLKEHISAHTSPVTVLVARSSTSGSSSGSSSSSASSSRRSKSGSSTRSKHSSKMTPSSIVERPEEASTKDASEASPALPSLSQSRPADIHQNVSTSRSASIHQTPILEAQQPQSAFSGSLLSSASSSSSSAVSAAAVSRPLVQSATQARSAVASIHPSPVTAIGPSPVAPAADPSPITNITNIATSSALMTANAPMYPGMHMAAKPAHAKAPLAVASLGDGDIFSPLKTAPSRARADHPDHRLASSPQLGQPSLLDGVRKANASSYRPSPLVAASSRDANWPAAPALRSMQQAEGMETCRTMSAPTAAAATTAVATQRFSAAVATAAGSSSGVTSALTMHLQQHAAQSAGAHPISRQLPLRDTIDGRESSPPSRSSAQSAPPIMSPQSLSHRHILGAATSAAAAAATQGSGTGSNSAYPGSTTLPSNSGTLRSTAAFTSPPHAPASVHSIAATLDQLVSPTKPTASGLPPAASVTSASSSVVPASSSPLPFHTAMLQRMIDESVDELRLAMHQHIRNVHVNLIRQIGDQTAELLAAQAQQYEVTEALLLEMQFLREEVRRMQERY